MKKFELTIIEVYLSTEQGLGCVAKFEYGSTTG